MLFVPGTDRPVLNEADVFLPDRACTALVGLNGSGRSTLIKLLHRLCRYWSPDGTEIVFALDPSNDEFTHPRNRVYVISADGADLRLVDGSSDFTRQVEWVD